MQEVRQLRQKLAEAEKENDFLKKQWHSLRRKSISGISIHQKTSQIFLSKTTVHKYMNKELHLQCVCRHKRPGYKKGHAHKIFPNLLNRNTGKWITSDLAIRTLEKALRSQKKKPRNLILHSDQGSQFTSIQFIGYCQKHGITQSMSAAGCPYDNAPMERYYNTLKAELVNRFDFRTDEELTYAISEYAYVWYNQVRPHSYND